MRSFCYALTEGYWVVGGPINNGGIALKWFKDQFAGDERVLAEETGEQIYDIITREAERIQPGSEGLLFLPYLTGERAPHWNAQARGVFFGAGLNHRRQHFMRAVLEGVVFSAFSVYQSLMSTEQSGKSLLATGGFVRSPVWLQMTADVFGVPVHVLTFSGKRVSRGYYAGHAGDRGYLYFGGDALDRQDYGDLYSERKTHRSVSGAA